MRIGRALAAAVLPIIVASSCKDGDSTRTSIADASARFAMTAAAITGQDAPIASEVASSASYMGFDTGDYPGERGWGIRLTHRCDMPGL